MTDGPDLPNEMRDSFAEDGDVAAFRHLPDSDQRNFIRWITARPSSRERTRRAGILRDALRLSPLAWEARAELPNRKLG